MKFIKAVEIPNGTHVTKKFAIETLPDSGPKDADWTAPAGTPLGIVKWHPGWRRYAFFPAPGTLFEPTCLRDLADFCETQTQTRKAERKEELRGLVK